MVKLVTIIIFLMTALIFSTCDRSDDIDNVELALLLEKICPETSFYVTELRSYNGLVFCNFENDSEYRVDIKKSKQIRTVEEFETLFFRDRRDLHWIDTDRYTPVINHIMVRDVYMNSYDYIMLVENDSLGKEHYQSSLKYNRERSAAHYLADIAISEEYRSSLVVERFLVLNVVHEDWTSYNYWLINHKDDTIVSIARVAHKTVYSNSWHTFYSTLVDREDVVFEFHGHIEAKKDDPQAKQEIQALISKGLMKLYEEVGGIFYTFTNEGFIEIIDDYYPETKDDSI